MTGPQHDQYFYTCMPSPFGLIGLVATPAGLCEICTQVSSEASFKKYLKKAYPVAPEHAPGKLKTFKKQLAEYFAGRRTQFDCDLDLEQGTVFQRQVWKALMKIPYGETRSYAWLAKAVRKPAAARAVGNANGRNPIPIIIPCHRVIRQNGSLGGYTGGIEKKQLLLGLECA